MKKWPFFKGLFSYLFLQYTHKVIEIIQGYLEINVALSAVLSIFLRTLSVIIAPIPGTPLDIINIALFSGVAGFIYAMVSIIIGSSVNFWIGRRFGLPVLGNFIPLDKVELWQSRINEKSTYAGVTFIRIITIPIFDYLSYVAGLTKMSYWKFILTTTLSAGLPMALFYYFGGIVLGKELYPAIILIAPFFIISSLFHKGKIFKRFADYLSIQDGWRKINNIINGNKKEG